MSNPEIDARYTACVGTVKAAATTALGLFRQRDQLKIESKGLQDWVSNADLAVETEIRDALSAAFPDDAIVGEEHGIDAGSSEYTWIIDPIDGTTCFVNGLPGWCVVVACVRAGETVIGVILDPISNELFAGSKGGAAVMNDTPLAVATANSLQQGSIAVGHSLRVAPVHTANLLRDLLLQGGLYYRTGSGALNLAYVAAGRLLGYCEPHMNAWDCVAGLFLIDLAGGRTETYQMSTMLASGGRVLAGGPGVYDQLLSMADKAYVD